MSSSLKFLAGIILALILIGTALQLKGKITKSTEIEELKNDTKELAEIANSLSSQEKGSQKPYRLQIPADCKIMFENNSVKMVYQKTYSFNTNIEITGKTLINGEYRLLIRKKEEKVQVFVR